MKDDKNKKSESKHTAEYWVTIAREFGEKCLKIQKDEKLSVDQKLEKQRILSDEMGNEIQKDAHLSEKEKSKMMQSLQTYMDEWCSTNEALQKVLRGENTTHKQ